MEALPPGFGSEALERRLLGFALNAAEAAGLLPWAETMAPDERERLRTDPVDTIGGFRLTDDERRALLAGDVGRLAQMGAHGYLLGSLGQHKVLGLTPETYVQRIHQPMA